MALKHEVRTNHTIDTINKTLDQGIKKISVLIRHSDRFFSKEAQHEPFMGLTDIGKDFAFDFGLKLGSKLKSKSNLHFKSNLVPKLYSSTVGRCIETAYLIDKGFTSQNNILLDHNVLADALAPLYVKDIERAVDMLQNQDNDVFLRNWFDKRIDESIMKDPEKTADALCEFMVEQIKNLKKNQIALCISHDWSIYPLKEFKMNLKLETAGDVGYLDSLVFFEKENQYYITNYQSERILL